jgi:hypothetical protein
MERLLDENGALPVRKVDIPPMRPLQPMSDSAQNHRAAALEEGMGFKTEIIDLTEGMDD